MSDCIATLGSKIKTLRLEHKLTQREVAEAIGVSKAAVSQWELDIAVPQGDNLIRLAHRLSVAPDQLLWGKPSPQVAPLQEARLCMAISCLESELGARFLGLPLAQRAKLLAYLYNRGQPLQRNELAALLDLMA
jgi:transcriptional regulator with XRE-family HTH domain